jgi:thiosulfate dehydrogenase [quinone] large subunit
MSVIKTKAGTIVQDPPLARFLFSDTRFAPVWGVIRVLLGLAWIDAGWHKVSSPAWTVTGDALKGFWTAALAIPDGGTSKITYDWYRGFLQGLLDSGSYVWFAKLIAFGELFIGIAFVLGAFVGIAAFCAAFMNWNFIMAGSASSNGLYMVGALLLLLAWKTAGYYGADRFLLPRLGTPWKNVEPEPDSPKASKPERSVGAL